MGWGYVSVGESGIPESALLCFAESGLILQLVKTNREICLENVERQRKHFQALRHIYKNYQRQLQSPVSSGKEKGEDLRNGDSSNDDNNHLHLAYQKYNLMYKLNL